ncbi:MAG TPA: NUDIX domain-containing protein [Clostridia bacterium]|nr:NUDIX domain-containing protein [Clostridia bacterium]
MVDKANTLDELLDLVDENDQVIGQVTKRDANSNPSLFHRAIAIIIYDNKGRILLQQRSLKKKVFTGLWTVSCAGHVPKGISYEQAAHKELLEELGFDTNLKFIKKLKIVEANETHFYSWFIGKYKGEKICFEPEEVEQVKFVDQNEFSRMVREGKVVESSARAIKQFWAEGMQMVTWNKDL